MPCTATVATRPLARAPAVMPPATSIWDISQPPKMSPLGLVSRGMARVRMAISPRGSGGASAATACPAGVSVVFTMATTSCYLFHCHYCIMLATGWKGF